MFVSNNNAENVKAHISRKHTVRRHKRKLSPFRPKHGKTIKMHKLLQALELSAAADVPILL